MNQYDFTELPYRMHSNSDNTLTYFNRSGQEEKLTHKTLFFYAYSVYQKLEKLKSKHDLKRVILLGDPDLDWVVAALGVIFSGAELVALPESMSEVEISASIEGLDINLALVTSKKNFDSVFSSIITLNLQDFCEPFDDDKSEPPAVSTISVAKQLIAYTSGSTANLKLKAFHVPFDSSIAFTDRFRELYSINKNDNWLICHSFSHIVHFEYLIGGLYWGYNITLASVFQVLMKGAHFKPSVLVTVPNVYDQIAVQIRRKIEASTDGKNKLEEILSRKIIDDNGNIIRYPLNDAAKVVLGDKLKMMLIGASPSSLDLQTFLLQLGLPLYEGYGMSELNMISCNTPNNSRLSTVGPTWPGVELMINEDGCILARSQPTRAISYINADNETNSSTFLTDGWVNTGDLGRIENACLQIIGREKDIIVNEGGKNINPSAIESNLLSIPSINHAVVYGDRKPYLVAVLSSDMADIEAASINKHLDSINHSLPIHQRILSYILADTPFSIDNGTLTRSGKPRRANVIEHYQDQINALYN